MIDEELEFVKAERDAFKKEAQNVKKLLNKLLNQVHRDGGYCTHELGIEKSTENACDQVNDWFKMERRFNETSSAYSQLKDIVEFFVNNTKASTTSSKEMNRWADVFDAIMRGGK